MSSPLEEFWSTLPEKVMHPLRVPIIEALWWIGEPLSALRTVDVLDGHLSMWEAAHHLRVLETLDVVEPVPPHTGQTTSQREVFDVRYRLKVVKDE